MREYIEPPLGDPDALVQAVQWMRAARARIEVLETQQQRLEQALASKSEAANKREVEMQALVRMAARRRGMELHRLGQDVLIVDRGVVGVVTGISIDRGGAKYWVRWWEGGTRLHELLDCDEVDVVNESLPHRQEG